MNNNSGTTLQTVEDDDPRLKNIQTYWLQLTSYDLEKIINKRPKFYVHQDTSGRDSVEKPVAFAPDKTNPIPG